MAADRNGNGSDDPRPTARDLRLGEAIAQRLIPAFTAAIAPRFERLEGALADMRGDLTGMREDLNEVRADLNDVRADLNDVRADLNEVRTDLNDVRDDVRGLRKDVKQLQRSAVGVGRMVAVETRVSKLERKR